MTPAMRCGNGKLLRMLRRVPVGTHLAFMRWYLLRMVVLLLALAMGASSQTMAAKKRIAVMDFESAGGTVNGKLFGDTLTAQLEKDGRYAATDRRTVEKTTKGEQLTDAMLAAALGRLLRADGVVAGTVVETEGLVNINARLVSTETTEILVVVTGKGASAALAAADVALKIDAFADRLPAYVVVISGLVADVSGKTLVLNVGSKAGVRVGDRLTVRRATRDVKDPTTGAVLRKLEDTVGEVTVTEVDEMSSLGRFTGPALAMVGDIVKSL